MKTEEAIKTLKGTLSLLHQTNITFDDVTDYREAMNVAVKALEKQVPKKIIQVIEASTSYKCPSCMSYIPKAKFCRNCGQAIYLSEVE